VANFWAEAILGQGSSGVARPAPRAGLSEWMLQEGGRSPTLLAGGGDAMYAAQMFSQGGVSGGSGAPSPAPYSDQYGGAQYGARSSGGAFSAEPYYREYFAGEGVTAATYQRPIYESDGVSGGDRYARPYHGKGVIAGAGAGLTVDLPSPDSGIGADAVTPRDQPATHQVSTQTE
jgi:hypothetical protein